MSEKEKTLSDEEKIEKFEFLFPSPEEYQRTKSIVQLLYKNKIGLRKKKNQTMEEAEVEFLLRVQYAQAIGLPLSMIGKTYVVDGNVELMVDAMMYMVAKHLPESEFEVLELSPKMCIMRARKSPNHKWIGIRWTIEKASHVVSAFIKKDIWEYDPEDMLLARAYGTLASAIAKKELFGSRAFRSAEELDNLGIELIEENEMEKDALPDEKK